MQSFTPPLSLTVVPCVLVAHAWCDASYIVKIYLDWLLGLVRVNIIVKNMKMSFSSKISVSLLPKLKVESQNVLFTVERSHSLILFAS